MDVALIDCLVGLFLLFGVGMVWLVNFSLNIFLRRLYIHSELYDCCSYPSTDRYGDTSILKLKQYILSIKLTSVSDEGVALVGNSISTLPRISNRFGR
jgi:hypothetical protein